jgi:hypothetical protein
MVAAKSGYPRVYGPQSNTVGHAVNFAHFASPQLFPSFDLLGPLTLAQPHARSAAVLIDQFDAGQFKGPLNDLKSRAARGTLSRFELANRHDPHACLVSQLLLGPIEQAPSGPALCRRNHGAPNSTILMLLAKYDEISS